MSDSDEIAPARVEAEASPASGAMHVLMVAPENDGIRGGKVGGIGDVIRDAAPALADAGCRVTVATPSHGFLHRLNQVEETVSFHFDFRGNRQPAWLHTVTGRSPRENVAHRVIDAQALAAPGDRIYMDDPPDSPYAADATRFAAFGAAVIEALRAGLFGAVDVVHLHDWPAAFFLILRAFHSAYRELTGTRTIYSIHNLAYQGVRPFGGHDASLNAFFPGMWYDYGRLVDRRWPDTFNPMAAAIRLADAVHTVSPAYADEITRPSRHAADEWIYGGEGLEADIADARERGRLHGILNGCVYPPERADGPLEPKPDFAETLATFEAALLGWMGASDIVRPEHVIALARIQALRRSGLRPETVMTSVGRLTDQKALLMRRTGGDGQSGLAGILDALGGQGLLILLGTGDPEYEGFFRWMSGRRANFLFLAGYSDACAHRLYRGGDLFLMPSSFEPCGISQMLAMREGQPCLVHGVGGLRDTVSDGENGFVFNADTLRGRVDAMVAGARRALDMKRNRPERFARIAAGAARERFLWSDTVEQYIGKLYRPPPPATTTTPS